MPSFLEEVIAHKLEELKEKESRRPLASFKSELKKGSFAFQKALAGEGLKLIAELKPRSPSLGDFSAEQGQEQRLNCYENYAAAVSVLCDQKYFGGSVELLAGVSARLKIPTLLKDFVINPYQLYEGRYAGAQAALLIVKILSREQLVELNQLCRELGMSAVVEVQTEEELIQAECINPELLLINNRNLDNLEIDLKTVERLSRKIPPSCMVIAASGIETGEQLLATRPFASRFLIGSSLMKVDDPAEKFEEFLQAEKTYQASKSREGSSCP